MNNNDERDYAEESANRAELKQEEREYSEAMAAEQAENCGRRWVAEIELCPRCGLNASAHSSIGGR